MSRGILAAGSAQVSEMVATLPSHLQRHFHQAKALYRFLANPRVGAEALLERVCRESALALEGEEVLVFLDLSPVRKPHARALEGIAQVGWKREAGYELLTARCGRRPSGWRPWPPGWSTWRWWTPSTWPWPCGNPMRAGTWDAPRKPLTPRGFPGGPREKAPSPGPPRCP